MVTTWSSAMLEKRTSPIHGYGLFATQELVSHQLLINWMKNSIILNADRYDQTNQTSIRLFGNLCLDGDKEDTDYINHSDQPNCIFLFGMVFSMKAIKKDEELTLDYRIFLPQTDTNVVQGQPAPVALTYQMNYMLRHWDEFKILGSYT